LNGVLLLRLWDSNLSSEAGTRTSSPVKPPDAVPMPMERSSYHHICVCVTVRIVDDPKKYHAVIVMGTPGTGKTVCGLYATHHLLIRST
jgi:hypothetical protein